MIAVIDYGCGNLTSLAESLRRLKVRFRVTADPSEIGSSDGVILPGVGHFGHAVDMIERLELRPIILDSVAKGVPLLGICLGMQLLADWSEEAGEGAKGLGLIPGVVRNIGGLGVSSLIPHVGWNELRFVNPSHPMAMEVAEGRDVYFVHSYAVVLADQIHLVGVTHHDVELVAAIAKDHVWGVQFHPEKSSSVGHRVLKNFVDSLSC